MKTTTPTLTIEQRFDRLLDAEAEVELRKEGIVPDRLYTAAQLHTLSISERQLRRLQPASAVPGRFLGKHVLQVLQSRPLRAERQPARRDKVATTPMKGVKPHAKAQRKEAEGRSRIVDFVLAEKI